MSRYPAVRAVLRIVVGVLALAGIALATDLILTKGSTARGVVVAGIPAGHLDDAQAQTVLDDLADRATRRVALSTSTGTVTVPPDALGLTFDRDATLERMMEQPRNPVTRALGLVGVERTVQPVVRVDRAAVDATLDANRPTLEKAAVEGGVHYDGATPVADLPAAGQRVARDAAMATLADRWLYATPVSLPLEDFSPTVSADVVRQTVAGAAIRAVAGQLTFRGTRPTTVRVEPAQLGSILTFGPDGNGGLRPVIDRKRGVELLGPRLARTERAPVEARISVSSGRPTVVPSRDGSRVDWEKTFDSATAVATGADASDARVVEVAYEQVKPRLDTAAANRLGIREVVSEFSTSGFSSESGENIRLVAQEVDGALVKPGATFSLNTHTGPRGSAQGYVTSTIIDHGHAEKAVGGGISQFATTLYNAAYFAGLEDVDHTEHSYYISRYPEAREATVFEGAIDLKFRNNSRTGIYIETGWSPSGVTVRLWGTKTREVQSVTGDRSAYTDPPSLKFPKGDNCIASSGSRGFTTSNTRIITDVRTGAEIGRHTRTVKYDPEPKVSCV
ncbi:VanW family protein [Gordonia sp. ABSL11-1]|uniref:VanW family protein n=1 Tax=Gordonia sp. ABSL11-1 TaxID=3053924 RepID=UPI0025739BC3|nr:VanW family protein [Gordonia sp. ABSL11-1]MDL9946630.1 VanW family protein [Gordonia sp. ABSL11-1]